MSDRLFYPDVDRAFHHLLVAHCDNALLISAWKKNQDLLHWIRICTLSEDSYNASAEIHMSIINAIKEGDEASAVAKLSEHRQSTKEAAIRRFKKMNGE